MKRRYCSALVIVCFTHLATCHANVQLPKEHGKVNMTGAIISTACDISMESRYQVIDMGNESINSLKHNIYGRNNPFSIHLVNCTLAQARSETPWQFIEVIFDGADANGNFSVNGDAKGVALRIERNDGVIASPGAPMPYIPIDSSDIRLDYNLRLLKQSNEMTPGKYSSVIKYRINYY